MALLSLDISQHGYSCLKWPFLSKLATFHFRCQNDSDWCMNYIGGDCEEIIEATVSALLSNALSFGEMIMPKEKKTIRSSLEKALIEKVPYKLIYSIKTSKNNEKLLFEQGIGLYDESGKAIELTGFISDITS